MNLWRAVAEQVVLSAAIRQRMPSFGACVLLRFYGGVTGQDKYLQKR